MPVPCILSRRYARDRYRFASVAPAMPTNPDYGHLGTPSVWRHRQHAAAKVEALSSHGMDEIEIPAFLRKQAD